MLHALSLAEVDLMTYPWLVTMATMSADNKKVPPVNLAAAEKEFLLALALKSQAMIKNKKSNKVTVYLGSKIVTTTNYRHPSLLNST